MKQRLKNWITSVVGILVMAGALVWKFLPRFTPLEEGQMISNMEFGTLLFLGWVFLTAKNSLLTGILGNFIKFKNSDDEGDSH